MIYFEIRPSGLKYIKALRKKENRGLLAEDEVSDLFVLEVLANDFNNSEEAYGGSDNLGFDSEDAWKGEDLTAKEISEIKGQDRAMGRLQSKGYIKQRPVTLYSSGRRDEGFP